MYMKNEEENQKKPIFKTSLLTDDYLYEMVYDRITNTTSFSGGSHLGEVKFLLELWSGTVKSISHYRQTITL